MLYSSFQFHLLLQMEGIQKISPEAKKKHFHFRSSIHEITLNCFFIDLLFTFLIHSANPISWPVVISYHTSRPSVRSKIVMVTGGTLCLAKWISDDTCLVDPGGQCWSLYSHMLSVRPHFWKSTKTKQIFRCQPGLWVWLNGSFITIVSSFLNVARNLSAWTPA